MTGDIDLLVATVTGLRLVISSRKWRRVLGVVRRSYVAVHALQMLGHRPYGMRPAGAQGFQLAALMTFTTVGLGGRAAGCRTQFRQRR